MKHTKQTSFKPMVRPANDAKAVMGWVVVTLVAVLGFALSLSAAQAQPLAQPLASLIVKPDQGDKNASFDGVVEALRQTVIAAQVAGAIVQIEIKAGDLVKAGQVLMRIDPRAADQAANASEAQAQAV